MNTKKIRLVRFPRNTPATDCIIDTLLDQVRRRGLVPMPGTKRGEYVKINSRVRLPGINSKIKCILFPGTNLDMRGKIPALIRSRNGKGKRWVRGEVDAWRHLGHEYALVVVSESD
jgi:hypothetical protein